MGLMNISLTLKTMAGIKVLVSCTRVPKFPVAQIAGARLHFSSVLSQSILGCENTFAAFILATFHQFMFCYQNACAENLGPDKKPVRELCIH